MVLAVDADVLPTVVLHRCALWGNLGNGRRLCGLLDQSLTLSFVATNQAVGKFESLRARQFFAKSAFRHVGEHLAGRKRQCQAERQS